MISIGTSTASSVRKIFSTGPTPKPPASCRTIGTIAGQTVPRQTFGAIERFAERRMNGNAGHFNRFGRHAPVSQIGGSFRGGREVRARTAG